ncbi:MAG: hypothetical protein OEM15_16045 [Myxococcales bacterium]|nr:hypothetical protein [Myxococcales bacterium]MDH3483625.1 hypothetical protein [Myxococcales bacterium]
MSNVIMERFVLWHRILPPAFEEEETTAAAGQWARYVTNEVQKAGGEMISSLAGTVVSSFALHELRSAINLALRLLAEADGQPVPAGGLPIAFGIATGDVQRAQDDAGRLTNTGSAIDRAQLLANQARAGEVVLDIESREAASRTYLFGRSVSTTSFTLRGEAIDRTRPLVEECRQAVSLLNPAPVPASVRHAFEPLKKAAAGSRTCALYLDGELGVGARAAILAFREELQPPAFLEIGAVPGGLEPLGGLRLALLKSWRALEPTRRGLKASKPGVADALKAIACATPPTRDAAVHAMKVTLQALKTDKGLPWIYIDRVLAADPATLSVLGAALEDDTVAALLCVRTIESKIPASLKMVRPALHIPLSSLEPNEALLIAGAMLGPETDSDIAKQAVIMGGTTVLGLTEAVRTMVATGDIVHDGSGFRWREDAQEQRQYLGPRALLEERFATLDTSSMRYLEIACAALPASSQQVVDAAVALDGVPKATRGRALDALINDGLLNGRAKPDSELLRRAVVQRMPPARRTEVYRFVAQALHESEPLVGPSMAATVGAYLCEGGDLERGAHAILEAGSLAADQGYTGTAVRLAAAAVQYQPDKETRSAASEISRSVRLPSRPPEEQEDDERPTMPVPEAERENPAEEVIRALKEQDHEAFDARVDAAIAAGADLLATHCLQVFSFVTRGDVPAARHALELAKKSGNQNAAASIRIGIASACLRLAQGRARDAMLDALDALATARAQEDGLGEVASLKMISTSCLAAGLESDAERLAHVAAAVAS